MQVTGQQRTSVHEQSRKSNCALSAWAIMIRIPTGDGTEVGRGMVEELDLAWAEALSREAVGGRAWGLSALKT